MTRYGRWTVTGDAPAIQWNKRVVCVCDCGTEKVVNLNNLRRGLSKSCGCLRDELAPQRGVRHGHSRKGSRSPEYSVWVGMLGRCYLSHRPGFADYGGRGITVCDRWRFGEGGVTAFECFLSDMGTRPSLAHSIERTNNHGNYEPSNCRWATGVEQSRNTRRNRIVEINGKKMALAEAIERFSPVSRSTVHSRFNYGWSDEAAILTPVYGRSVESSKERQRAKPERRAS